MKKQLALLSILFAAAFGSVWGQTPQPAITAPFSARYEPQLQSRPHPIYPVNALVHDISGNTVLCCTPNRDRELRCRVAWEAPENNDFGSRARGYYQSQRMTADSYAEYQTQFHGAPFPVFMQFRTDTSGEAPQRPAGVSNCARQE